MRLFRPAFPILAVFLASALSTGGRLSSGDRAGLVHRTGDRHKWRKTRRGGDVVVARRIPWHSGKDAPSWIGDSTLTTDNEGRFTLTFPPDQANDTRLSFTIAKVEHPDFVARKGSTHCGGPDRGPQVRRRAAIPHDQARTRRGVLRPDRAARWQARERCSFWLFSFTRSNIVSDFQNLLTGRTDADGRFRMRLPRSTNIQIRIKPPRFQTLQKTWQPRNNGRNANWLPSDLGTVAQARTRTHRPGSRPEGRTDPRTGDHRDSMNNGESRTTTTDDHGYFALARCGLAITWFMPGNNWSTKTSWISTIKTRFRTPG